jgi:hypothetical protein
MNFQDCLDLWGCAERVIDGLSAGLKAPSLWHPARFRVLGYAMLSSSTLPIALEQYVRYQKIVSDESSIELTPVGQRCFADAKHFFSFIGGFSAGGRCIDIYLVAYLSF